MPKATANFLTIFLFALSLGLSLPNLGKIQLLVMDEAQTVPGAQSYLGLVPPSSLNSRNPPFGKEVLALSIKIFGDNFFAYRLPSALAAAFTVVLIFRGMLLLTQSNAAGLVAAGLWLTSTLAYLHGRLATLDMMMTCWMLAAAVVFLKSMKHTSALGRARWLWVACALAALGAAVKVLVLLLFPWFLFGLLENRAAWPLKKSLPHFFAAALLLPAEFMALSYQAIGYSLSQIPAEILRMVKLQSTLNRDFSGLSPWYDWFLMKGNLLFYSSVLPTGARYSMLCANNPVLWIGGALSVLLLPLFAWKYRDFLLSLIALMVPMQIAFWLAFKKQTILSYGLALEPWFCWAIALVLFYLCKSIFRSRWALQVWGLSLVAVSGVFFFKKLPLVRGQWVELRGPVSTKGLDETLPSQEFKDNDSHP